MTRQEAIALIDAHKNSRAVIHPVALLHWTYLRVIINHLTDEEWDNAFARALPVLMQ